MSHPRNRKPSNVIRHAGNREAFVRLPRAEYLINDLEPQAKKELGKIVLNHNIEIDDRISLTVPDNRMADIGIFKGDQVIVQKRRRYHDGEVLAVKLGERVFIRRFSHSGNRIRLEASTPNRQSMILDLNTPGFSIIGSVVQVIKEL